jgi:hypothetical protein
VRGPYGPIGVTENSRGASTQETTTAMRETLANRIASGSPSRPMLGQTAGAAFKDVEARKTKMLVAVCFSRWFGAVRLPVPG